MTRPQGAEFHLGGVARYGRDSRFCASGCRMGGESIPILLRLRCRADGHLWARVVMVGLEPGLTAASPVLHKE